jgi:hypothetical protein
MRPTPQELLFLNKGYNCFYDLHEEVMGESFWNADPYYRFSRLRDAFLIYSELIEYVPIVHALEALKNTRPPMEAELAKECCLFIRNVLIHFPLFKSWNEVSFTKQLINWSKPGRTIDKFLAQFAGHAEVKYRVWFAKSKSMVYVTITFPEKYDEATEIRLRDMIPERDGAMFTLSLMRRVLDTQVEETGCL